MVAGMERYFQIARCFRDEDLRADRQPEFTQVDIEASFITPEDIYNLVESMLKRVYKESLGVDIPPPSPHDLEGSNGSVRFRQAGTPLRHEADGRLLHL